MIKMNVVVKNSIFIFIIILFASLDVVKVGASVPVTYKCCQNYSYDNGTLFDGFEGPESIIQIEGFENTTVNQIENFENIGSWKVGGSGSQQADTINFKDGSQGLKLIANGSQEVYSEKTINNNFSNVSFFSIWVYVYGNNFLEADMYITSTGSNWNSYFSKALTNLNPGWNLVVIDKNTFRNNFNESWYNVMNRIRIEVYAKNNNGTSATFDDFGYYLPEDWVGSSQQADTINFKEGRQGLKLTVNGSQAYSIKMINNNFSNVSYFSMWIYVYDTNFLEADMYITSTGSNWSSYFSKAMPNLNPGWNLVVIDKNTFRNNFNENWDNVMNRMIIGLYPKDNNITTSATFDSLGYYSVGDWVGPSQEPNKINVKEGKQGLKLISINGSEADTDKIINNTFDINNFAFWVYVDNGSNLSYIKMLLSSTNDYSKYFYESIGEVRSGWNKIVFNKHSLTSNFNESWNSTMVRIKFGIAALPGTNVNVTFDDLRTNLTGKRAKLFIEFDDGLNNTYTNAYPVLYANNQTATVFVISSYVNGTPTYMTLDQLKGLQSYGWDISSHSVDHPELASVNDSQLTYELNASYDWLVANNFQKTAGFIAYPFGSFNENVLQHTEKRYILGRSVYQASAQQQFDSDPSIWYIQRIIEVQGNPTLQYVEDNINDTINSKLLGILVFHGIVHSNPDYYENLVTDFKNISDYVKSRKADIDVIKESDYVIPNINNFTPVINKTTRIYSNGTATLITNNGYDEYMPNMTIDPLSDSIDIRITDYNETSGHIRFNESNSNSNVNYNIGDRIPNQRYLVKIYWPNGSLYQNFDIIANNTGYISYNSSGFGFSRNQEIMIGQPIDTTFTVTLPIGYTYVRFNASNSTMANLNPDGQNNLQPIFKIVNNGNINQSFILNLNSTVANITTYADLSNNFSQGKIEINTSNTTIIPNLTPGSNQNIWIIIDTNKAPAININKTLIINGNNS